NSIVRDSSIESGHIIPWFLRRLQSARIPLRELTAPGAEAAWLRDSEKLQVFDAMSWAFTHYLLFGDKGAHQGQLERFVALLAEGKTPAVALELAFGDVEALSGRFFQYVQGQLFAYARLETDVKVRQDEFATRTMSLAESVAIRAAYHAATQRPVEARAEIAAARKADAAAPGSYEAEGVLLDSENKTDDARAAFGKAVERGST